jgi:hypothetical protein
MATFYHGKGAFGMSPSAVSDSITMPGTIAQGDLTSCLRSISFPRPQEVAETSAFGTSAKTFVPGMITGTVSVQGMFDSAAMSVIEACYGANAGGASGNGPLFWFGPSGTISGRVRYVFNGIITSIQLGATINDMVSAQMDVQINGAVTRNTWP